MAYLLLTIIIPLDTLLFGQKQSTYVPGGQRWNKTNAFFNVICISGTTWVDYIISMKVDYKYRRKRGGIGH